MTYRRILLVFALLWISGDVVSQDLEPRRWSHLPSDVNFIGVATGYTDGDILFDPALLIEDVTFKQALLAAGYIRTFDWYGKSARIDVGLPYVNGSWKGLVNSEPASVRRQGFGDVKVRLSMNLIGAPALKGKEFAQYGAEHPVNTTVGAAIAIVLPSGEYRSDQLINLGENRYMLRPQIGVLHERRKWQFEVTGTVFFYGENREFWMGTTRKQDPMWAVQGHVIHTFRPGLWASFSTGYGHGGRSYIDGVAKADDSRLSYWAVSFGFPINQRQGLKIAYVAKETNTILDSKYDGIVLGWSMMFGN